MGTGIEPTNDFAFKFVFGTEERTDVLASLLNAVITDSCGVPMQHVKLTNPYSVKEAVDDRIGILDISARDNLDRWAYFLKHGSTLDPNNLPPQLQNDGIVKAVGGLVMLSLDEQKQHEYTRRRLWEMDQRAYIDGATKKGRTEGLVKGRTEGLAEGALAILLRVGTRTLGHPPAEVLAHLKAVETVAELEALMDRLLEISSWDELLAHRPSSSPKSDDFGHNQSLKTFPE
ncbi:MAG: PD-(D/E)XK nuclease family transposase [Planctomycetaceae bacterium]